MGLSGSNECQTVKMQGLLFTCLLYRKYKKQSDSVVRQIFSVIDQNISKFILFFFFFFFHFETAFFLGNLKLINLKISEKFDMKMEMMKVVQLI